MTQSKTNQTMKYGQLKEYNKRNSFLHKSWGKWGREFSSRPLFEFFKKLYIKVEVSVCSLVLIYFDSPQLGIQ